MTGKRLREIAAKREWLAFVSKCERSVLADRMRSLAWPLALAGGAVDLARIVGFRFLSPGGGARRLAARVPKWLPAWLRIGLRGALLAYGAISGSRRDRRDGFRGIAAAGLEYALENGHAPRRRRD
jgi:hypothetical protein